ncbi:hypothetical protein F5Y16DRAFT_373460 [Xylariaceae sp. FL0255]|nr:hypothetical protein F5Y16DRAFT_373460 [Xylariaceae sp. FL0255]
MMKGQGLRLIEPLRLLFEDKVREIGRRLGTCIHESLVNCHPFPGPGIAIRILGDVTKTSTPMIFNFSLVALEDAYKPRRISGKICAPRSILTCSCTMSYRLTMSQERVEIARQADYIFIKKIKEAGVRSGHATKQIEIGVSLMPFLSQISQVFAGLDTSRSVGVFGNTRVWGYIIILRAVRTKDFMSAETFNFENSILADVARTICKQVEGVSRVIYDF